MKNIIATKIGMTRIFDDKGISVSVTVLKVKRCWVVGLKNNEKHGYQAIQLGYDVMKEKKATKPYKGLFKNVSDGVVPKLVKEFRVNTLDGYALGQEITSEIFSPGMYVDVTGCSMGKGYAGAMKKHGFAGLSASHGHTEYRRAPGSMSASSYPSRVFKGKKLPGRMGSDRVTIQKIAVVKTDAENNLILMNGAVPGPRGSVVLIRETIKSVKSKK